MPGMLAFPFARVDLQFLASKSRSSRMLMEAHSSVDVVYSGFLKSLVGAVFRDAHAQIVGGLAFLGIRAVAVRLAVAAEAIVALRSERGVATLIVAVDGHLHDGALAGYGTHGAIEVACSVVEGAPHAGRLVERLLAIVVERVCPHHDVETIQR